MISIYFLTPRIKSISNRILEWNLLSPYKPFLRQKFVLQPLILF
jgi:hypothetical protein